MNYRRYRQHQKHVDRRVRKETATEGFPPGGTPPKVEAAPLRHPSQLANRDKTINTQFRLCPSPRPPPRRSNRRTPGLLEEGVIPTLRDAKARLFQPGFASIPCSAEVWAFCCESSELERMSRLSVSATGSFRAPSSERWKRCPGAAAPSSMHARPP